MVRVVAGLDGGSELPLTEDDGFLEGRDMLGVKCCVVPCEAPILQDFAYGYWSCIVIGEGVSLRYICMMNGR